MDGVDCVDGVDGVVRRVLERIRCSARPEAWLYVADEAQLDAQVVALVGRLERGQALPLRGVPFAVKDNIDVAGMPTSAGCPAYTYWPERSAAVVERLVEAGALVVGKTHMDQFATGLVGVRSPYGPCRNPHAAGYIAGGSSSGSAVVVAQGIVGFALGTDTAGSGRVPAALCGTIGLKPTRGAISLRGVVPACASLDCVSIFTARAADAKRVFAVAAGYDAEDPFSRRGGAAVEPRAEFHFGVLDDADLSGVDAEGRAWLASARVRLERLGGTAVTVDFRPFREVAGLLYGGPWIAERQAAVGDFIATHPHAVDATVAAIINGGVAYSARDAFAALHRLRTLAREAEGVWERIDVLLVPTAGRAFTIAEALADPLGPSGQLAEFNNFVNLLDLAAVAVPVGIRECGVPFGVTLAAPAFSEPLLLDIAERLEGDVGEEVPRLRAPSAIRLVVVGAHLSGMPLNGQLTTAGGQLEQACRTAPEYRLFALAGGDPPRPALVRVGPGGSAIDVEVWRLPPAGFARVVDSVKPPLAIGRVALDVGVEVAGFVCEPAALVEARDISEFGGWRAYRAAQLSPD